jgi:hypothetical protein
MIMVYGITATAVLIGQQIGQLGITNCAFVVLLFKRFKKLFWRNTVLVFEVLLKSFFGSSALPAVLLFFFGTRNTRCLTFPKLTNRFLAFARGAKFGIGHWRFAHALSTKLGHRRPTSAARRLAADFCFGVSGLDFLFGFFLSQNAFLLFLCTTSLRQCDSDSLLL